MVCRLLSIAGTVGVFPWPVCIFLSFCTTCTQGSPDSWMSALIGCTIFAAVTLILLLLSLRVDGHARMFRLVVPFVVLLPLLVTAPHAYQTAILGNHLCGEEFNDIEQDQMFCRLYYPCLWGMAGLVTLAGVLPFRIWWKDST